ncbi:MAG: polyhydroxyalkanoate synthesis regulator DNA-binding domain-containing protein [Candidatus Promineifilaceae bacterium]
MIVIKRYPNRKLYNTDAKQYVTLEEVALLIQRGQELQILDHASGEDLTAVTLTQVIMEQEKKQAGFLPRAVLAGLIQSGGQTLTSLRRTLASPLDLFHHIEQDIDRRLETLVAAGELSPEEGERWREKLRAAGQRPREPMAPAEADVERALAGRGLPSRDDLRRLNQRLDELSAKLDEIAPGEAAG